jgi:hypothetical protein
VAAASGIGVVAAVFAVFVVFPLGFSYVGTHAARPPVQDIDLGTVGLAAMQLSARLALRAHIGLRDERAPGVLTRATAGGAERGLRAAG